MLHQAHPALAGLGCRHAPLQAFDTTSVLSSSELDGLVLAQDNQEVLQHLARFYSLPIPTPAS